LVAIEKLATGGHGAVGQLKCACFDVDRDDLSVVACFNEGPNLGLVELVASMGMFFWAIAQGWG
jgi:hypothetical protein